MKLIDAALPPGSNIISVADSGSSLWVRTARIQIRRRDGSDKSYFMKVGDLRL